jgi:hypothetical protein
MVTWSSAIGLTGCLDDVPNKTSNYLVATDLNGIRATARVNSVSPNPSSLSSYISTEPTYQGRVHDIPVLTATYAIIVALLEQRVLATDIWTFHIEKHI